MNPEEGTISYAHRSILEGISDDIRQFTHNQFVPSPPTADAIKFVEGLQDRLNHLCNDLISFNNPPDRPRAGDLDRAVGEFIKRDPHDTGPGLNPDDEDREPDRDNLVGLGGGPFIPGPETQPSPDRDNALKEYPILDPVEERSKVLQRSELGAIILTALGFRRIRSLARGDVDDLSAGDCLSVIRVLQLMQDDGS